MRARGCARRRPEAAKRARQALIKRAYLIKLKRDADPARVEELVRALEETPRHIPSMCWSQVAREQSDYDWDLVWDHAFTGEAGYEAYSHHPYHCNQIDQFMYRESPLNVVERAHCMRWSDGEGEPMEASPDTIAGPVFVLEQVEVIPGKANEYLRAVAEEYLPLAEERGLRLAGSWRTPEGGGEDELTLLWQADSVADYHRIRVLFHHDEPRFSEWVARIDALRTGGRRRLLVPAPLAD